MFKKNIYIYIYKFWDKNGQFLSEVVGYFLEEVIFFIINIIEVFEFK